MVSLLKSVKNRIIPFLNRILDDDIEEIKDDEIYKKLLYSIPGQNGKKQTVSNNTENLESAVENGEIPVDDSFISTTPDWYLVKVLKTFKEKYHNSKTFEEAIEKVRKEIPGFIKRNVMEIKPYLKKMSEMYYDAREKSSPEYTELHIPSIIDNFTQIPKLDQFKILSLVRNKRSTENLWDILLERAISPNGEILKNKELDFVAYYFGFDKKPQITDAEKKDLEERLRLNTNPTKTQKIKAAFYFSNLLQTFYNPNNSYLNNMGDISVQEKKVHNSIANVSALTGIRSSTIRYWTRKLEKDEKVQDLRLERFSKRFTDLSEEEISKIYIDKIDNELTRKEMVEKYNLTSIYAASQINKYGEVVSKVPEVNRLKLARNA